MVTQANAEESQFHEAVGSVGNEGCASERFVSCWRSLDEILAPMTFEGGCDRQCFEAWLEQFLLPILPPGKTLIMDNASFHKGGRIQELVEAAKCQILYLPTYSPDLNRI